MSISFSCPCGKSFTVRDELAGKQTKCPACGAALVVPTPDSSFDVIEDEPPALEPVKKPRAVVAVEDDERPKAKKKKKKRKTEYVDREELKDESRAVAAEHDRKIRVVRSVLFIAFGLIITAGAGYMLAFHRKDINPLYAILIGLTGVLAVGKGIIGLFLGQLLGEED